MLFSLRVNAPEQYPCYLVLLPYQGLSVHKRRARYDARYIIYLLYQCIVILDAAVFLYDNVCIRAHYFVAQVIIKAAHYRKYDYERHHSDSHAQNRDEAYKRNNSFLAPRKQLP